MHLITSSLLGNITNTHVLSMKNPTLHYMCSHGCRYLLKNLNKMRHFWVVTTIITKSVLDSDIIRMKHTNKHLLISGG